MPDGRQRRTAAISCRNTLARVDRLSWHNFDGNSESIRRSGTRSAGAISVTNGGRRMGSRIVNFSCRQTRRHRTVKMVAGSPQKSDNLLVVSASAPGRARCDFACRETAEHAAAACRKCRRTNVTLQLIASIHGGCCKRPSGAKAPRCMRLLRHD